MALSPIEQLTLKLLSRIELAGLVASFYGEGPQPVVDPELHARPLLQLLDDYAEIFTLLDAGIRKREPDTKLYQSQPFIYNSQTFDENDPWGYSGDDGGAIVSLPKIVSGIRTLWDLQGSDSESALNRVAKASVWVAEKHRRPGKAFHFLLSLNRAGFFCDSTLLARSIERVARLFASNPENLNSILTFSFSEKDQQKATRITQNFSPGLDRAKLAEIGAWLLDQTMASAEDCRRAMSPTAWLSGIAAFSSLINATRAFESKFDVLDAQAVQYKTQFLGLEEIVCDFGSMKLCDTDYFTNSLSIEYGWSMASAMILMQTWHGKESVEYTLRTRVLVPDCLLKPVFDMVSTAEPGRRFEAFQAAPEEWRRFGLEVCHVLSRLRFIDHRMLRSTKIHVDDLSGSIDSTNQREEKKSQIKSLHTAEISRLIEEYVVAVGKDRAAQKLVINEMLERYPLNHQFLLERAIMSDEAGDAEAACEDLINAICLSPRDWMPWQSLSVVCRRLDFMSDCVVARVIADFLKERKDDDSSNQPGQSH